MSIMYDLTLEEILVHYISRIRLAIENIEKQKKDIEQLIDFVDEGINGDIKEALHNKLDESLKDTNDIYTHLEDSLFFLKKQMNEIEEFMDGNNQIFW